MKRLYGVLASSGMIAGVVAAAHADSVYVNISGTQGNAGRGVWVSLSDGMTFWDGTTSKTIWAGQRSMTIDGQLVKAYSAQVDSHATDGWKNTSTLSDALGAQRADAINALFASQNNGQFAGREQAAAFQALIWEIVYDYDGSAQSINLADGSVQVYGVKNAIFNSMKNAAMLRGGDGSNLRLITGDNGDAHIQVVPLPSAAGLAGVGLLGLLAGARRRRMG